jgi:hypothetical protein
MRTQTRSSSTPRNLYQGNLIEGEGSVKLTSLSSSYDGNTIYIFTKQATLTSSSIVLNLFQGSLIEGEGSVQLTSFTLTSLNKLIFKLKILFTFFAKQATLMRKSTVLGAHPQHFNKFLRNLLIGQIS